jgi:hypothetical protein
LFQNKGSKELSKRDLFDNPNAEYDRIKILRAWLDEDTNMTYSYGEIMSNGYSLTLINAKSSFTIDFSPYENTFAVDPERNLLYFIGYRNTLNIIEVNYESNQISQAWELKNQLSVNPYSKLILIPSKGLYFVGVRNPNWPSVCKLQLADSSNKVNCYEYSSEFAVDGLSYLKDEFFFVSVKSFSEGFFNSSAHIIDLSEYLINQTSSLLLAQSQRKGSVHSYGIMENVCPIYFYKYFHVIQHEDRILFFIFDYSDITSTKGLILNNCYEIKDKSYRLINTIYYDYKEIVNIILKNGDDIVLYQYHMYKGGNFFRYS